MVTENVFLFVPNIIGYSRIILVIVSFYYMPTDYTISSCCYIISGVLDALDGHAARLLNQSTKFGAMLDQLTDRCGTMGLLVTLSCLYPKYMFLFQLSMVIDISCHWIFLHSSLIQGKSSHKFIDMSENHIMRVYYMNRTVLFLMCFGNEAFFATLYLLHFTNGPIVGGISLLRVASYLTFPVMVIKTMISVIHGYVASCNLASVDISERKPESHKSK